MCWCTMIGYSGTQWQLYQNRIQGVSKHNKDVFKPNTFMLILDSVFLSDLRRSVCMDSKKVQNWRKTLIFISSKLFYLS